MTMLQNFTFGDPTLPAVFGGNWLVNRIQKSGLTWNTWKSLGISYWSGESEGNCGLPVVCHCSCDSQKINITLTHTTWTVNSATFTRKYTSACLYTFRGLININTSVGNTWNSQGKLREFDKDRRVVTLGSSVTVMWNNLFFCDYYLFHCYSIAWDRL